MSYFSSIDAYHHFSLSLRKEFRFCRDTDQLEFISSVLCYAKKHIETKNKGEFFFRSQIGKDERPMFSGSEVESFENYLPTEEIPFASDRMKPHAGLMIENRANPLGIPHLYCSTNVETAIAESRPWGGCFISVGEVHLLKDLKFVNCCPLGLGLKPYGRQLKEMNDEQHSGFVWNDVCHAFSIPVDRSDCHLDYISTQVISEEFKRSGYDGVIYKSNLGNGCNIVIFDLENIEIRGCCLHKVIAVDFKTEVINCGGN